MGIMPEHDLRQYLNIQAQETCRAFIIFAPAMAGKTALAKQMEIVLGAFRFDLQVYFLEQSDLSARIDRFRPKDLELILLGLDVSQNVVIVDNMDFLFNIWTPPMKREFMAMVDLRLKSPDITSKTFVFFLQTDPMVTGYRLTLQQRQQRILPLESFRAF